MGAPFEPGEIVKLKSGGAPMAVCSIDTTGEVNCFWHNYQAELCFAKLAPHILEKYIEKT